MMGIHMKPGSEIVLEMGRHFTKNMFNPTFAGFKQIPPQNMRIRPLSLPFPLLLCSKHGPCRMMFFCFFCEIHHFLQFDFSCNCLGYFSFDNHESNPNNAFFTKYFFRKKN